MFFHFNNEGSLVDTIDLQALNLSGTYCHKTSKRPPSCQLLDNRLFFSWQLAVQSCWSCPCKLYLVLILWIESHSLKFKNIYFKDLSISGLSFNFEQKELSWAHKRQRYVLAVADFRAKDGGMGSRGCLFGRPPTNTPCIGRFIGRPTPLNAERWARK